MSLVVSDSGPIHYLVLCEAIRLIPELYGELVIPGAVAQELAHPQTPEVVRAWLQALPNWARIRNPRQIEPVMQLGLGEREAISLAHELKASQLLIDDRVARRVAVERGLLNTAQWEFWSWPPNEGCSISQIPCRNFCRRTSALMRK